MARLVLPAMWRSAALCLILACGVTLTFAYGLHSRGLMTDAGWLDALLCSMAGLAAAGAVHFGERRGGMVFWDEARAADILQDRTLKLPAAVTDKGPMGARIPQRVSFILRLREAAWVAFGPACIISAVVMSWVFHWGMPEVIVLLFVGSLGAAAAVLAVEALAVMLHAYKVARAGRVAE